MNRRIYFVDPPSKPSASKQPLSEHRSSAPVVIAPSLLHRPCLFRLHLQDMQSPVIARSSSSSKSSSSNQQIRRRAESSSATSSTRRRSSTSMLLGAFIGTLALAPSASSFSWSPSQRHHHQICQPLFIASSRSYTLSPSQRTSSSWCLALSSSTSDETATISTLKNTKRLQTLASLANEALETHGSEIMKTFNAKVGVISNSPSATDDDDDDDNFQQKYLRLGLIATEAFNKDDQLVAALPFFDTDGSGLGLQPDFATKLVYKDELPEGYDGWTGDAGLLAMLLLNEFARLNADENGNRRDTGIDMPVRKEGIRALMEAWVTTLPSSEEMEEMHPLLWEEGDQEKLQSSSTKNIYRMLDDIDDDSSWLDEKVWSADRTKYPESVSIKVGDEMEERPCFSPDGFRYAVALIRSRSYFVDGALRLLPYLDYANHDDYDSYEIRGGGIGMLWGSAKGAILKSGKKLKVGDEVRISYGPKGPADYVLDHGFVPPMCQVSAGGGGSAVTAELTFEVDDSDRFRDDKLDILEYETYELAPMDPLQAFDVTGGPGSTGEPDPAMIQFLRLIHVGGKDAFLLESIFRKEIWGFMSEPVSEENERGAVTAVIKACENALSEMEGAGEDGESGDNTLSESGRLCTMVRASEREALDRTLVHVKQEAEALDLKEYYQSRRLKSLGLDSEWTPEDEYGSSGGNRVPGGADYDW